MLFVAHAVYAAIYFDQFNFNRGTVVHAAQSYNGHLCRKIRGKWKHRDNSSCGRNAETRYK